MGSNLGRGKLATILLLSFLVGCGNSYDKGYEDAWEERKDGLSYAINGNYKQGYDKGADDYWYHNRGCYDADAGNPIDSSLNNNSWYAQGYTDCS